MKNIWNSNVKAGFLLCKEALPFLKKSKNASILLLGSAAASLPLSGLGIYGMSKLALVSLSSGFRGGGAVRGGGGADALFPQGFDPLPTQRVPPLHYFEISIWLTDLKNFLKAPLAPVYSNFEEERAKQTRFFCRNFPKRA